MFNPGWVKHQVGDSIAETVDYILWRGEQLLGNDSDENRLVAAAETIAGDTVFPLLPGGIISVSSVVRILANGGLRLIW